MTWHGTEVKLAGRHYEINWRIEVKWQDAWIGCFWRRSLSLVPETEVWICLIPFVPIHLKVWKWK